MRVVSQAFSSGGFLDLQHPFFGGLTGGVFSLLGLSGGSSTFFFPQDASGGGLQGVFAPFVALPLVFSGGGAPTTSIN